MWLQPIKTICSRLNGPRRHLRVCVPWAPRPSISAKLPAGAWKVFWERDLRPWDIAAGSLIVAEAGGKVSACGGGGTFDPLGSEILVSNGLIHAELLEIITV